MASHFCITVRFLQPYYHGRRDAGRPEWPPSPLRLFQALVAAAAAHCNERVALGRSVAALRWFEQLPPPDIVAPNGQPSQTGYRSYVPDNVGDLLARSWVRGGTANIADIRVEKDVRPVHLEGEAVHFVFSVGDNDQSHIEFLTELVHSLTHLGWGIDMVVGHAELITTEAASQLDGHRWLPVPTHQGTALRAPRAGTLDELISKHTAFLNRLAADGRGNESFSPVPPLATFRTVTYRRATDPEPRRWAAFSLLKPDASSRRPFDTARRTRDVAGMVRHAIAEAARKQQWSENEINVFVHGKTPDGSGPSKGQTIPDRFLYLPLPTVNYELNRIESIRRVLVAAPSHCEDQVNWLRRTLAGAELRDESRQPAAVLTILPASDWVLKQYYIPKEIWSTVTPVILPVHDGYDRDSAGKWLCVALKQAGISSELIGQCRIEWRRVGFRSGVDLASRYRPPKNLENKPRYHVRIRFPHAIAGPIVVGSGRFRGFGLFVSEDEN